MKKINILVLMFASLSFSTVFATGEIVNDPTKIKIGSEADMNKKLEQNRIAQGGNRFNAGDLPINLATSPYSHNDFPKNSGSETFNSAISICQFSMTKENPQDPSKRVPKTKNDFAPLSEGYHYWIACMKSFYPFAAATNDDSIDCPATDMTWGNFCSSPIGAGVEMDVVRIGHNSDQSDYQGYASFECRDGNWNFLDGSCINDPDICPANSIVSWPVTSPEWAVLGNSTNPRYDPKPDCQSVVPTNELSGIKLGGLGSDGQPELPLSSPPMAASEIVKYDPILSTQNTFFRCYNGEWLIDPETNPECVYYPSTCAAVSYTTSDGCVFDIPSIPHNETVSVRSPNPENSVGTVVAHCFDGNIEIISESCQLSCNNERPAVSWDSNPPDNSQSCTHPYVNLGTRTPPDSVLSIENTNPSMSGEYSWLCEDGFFTFDSSSCNPKNCSSGIQESSYTGVDKQTGQNRTCTHTALTDSIPHGQRVVLSANNEDLVGNAYYICNYGTISFSGEQNTCTKMKAETTCDATGNTTAPEPSMIFPSKDNGCEIKCVIENDDSFNCVKVCDENTVCDSEQISWSSGDATCYGVTETGNEGNVDTIEGFATANGRDCPDLRLEQESAGTATVRCTSGSWQIQSNTGCNCAQRNN